MEEDIMSTFNDNIRRQLGFGLISWNTPEHRTAMNLSRPQSDKPARETGSTDTDSPGETLAGRAILRLDQR